MKFRDTFSKIVDVMGTVIFAIVLVVLSAQIFNRYVFGRSLFWAEELSVHLIIWITFLGAAKGVSINAHTRLTVLVNIMPPKVRYGMVITANLLAAVFTAIASWYGVSLVKNTWNSITIGTGTPLGLVYLAMPFSGAIMIIFLILNSIETVREMRGESPARDN